MWPESVGAVSGLGLKPSEARDLQKTAPPPRGVCGAPGVLVGGLNISKASGTEVINTSSLPFSLF